LSVSTNWGSAKRPRPYSSLTTPRACSRSAEPKGLDRAPNVRFGSKADMCSGKRDVCFTPNSGHSEVCPLSANSGRERLVTIRALVSGPVSLHTCLPTLLKRGSIVGS
jgi:hypothetical protein